MTSTSSLASSISTGTSIQGGRGSSCRSVGGSSGSGGSIVGGVAGGDLSPSSFSPSDRDRPLESMSFRPDEEDCCFQTADREHDADADADGDAYEEEDVDENGGYGDDDSFDGVAQVDGSFEGELPTNDGEQQQQQQQQPQPQQAHHTDTPEIPLSDLSLHHLTHPLHRRPVTPPIDSALPFQPSRSFGTPTSLNPPRQRSFIVTTTHQKDMLRPFTPSAAPISTIVAEKNLDGLGSTKSRLGRSNNTDPLQSQAVQSIQTQPQPHHHHDDEVSLMYDPILKCYYEPNSNQYYQLHT